MRTALLAVATLAATGLIVPTASAAAATQPDAQPAVATATAPSISYHDPAQADAATVSVTGTLTPIHSEVGETQYAVSLPDGRFVPVSLDASDKTADIDQPRTFHGDLAVADRVADRLDIADGQDLGSTSADGKAVLANASTTGTPLAAQSAVIGAQPTAAATTTAAPSQHRLYVAAITNVGTLPSSTELAREVNAIRTYWTTESDGVISSFPQVGATVSYSSTAATTSNGCGLGNAGATWNEAAAKFSGVDFSDPGNHLMVLVPNSCSGQYGAGIGTVGGSVASGGRTIVVSGDIGVEVGVHELGHNLSLQHANAERCSSSCTTQTYFDIYSIMGLAISGNSGWTPPSLDTSYRVQLGIAGSDVTTVTSTRTVRLAGRGTSDGTRGIVVTEPNSGQRYTVEYRSGTGRDAANYYAGSRPLSDYDYRPGVVVQRLETTGETTMMTQRDGSRYETSYLAGQRFTVGALSVAVGSTSPSTGADVTITLGATPPASNPTPTPTPPSTSRFTPGTPVVHGTPRVGSRLWVSPGTWSPAPRAYTVQWLVDGQPVAHANSWSFAIGSAAYAKRISARVTGYRSGYSAATATSAESAPVAAGTFRSRSVRVSGHAKIGRTLVARTPSWHPTPHLTYRWYANGHVIGKAHSRSLHITHRLAGKRITVRITARQHGYRTMSRLSARTVSVR